MDKRCYYEVLGLSRGAPAPDIKKAYRSKAKALHPDKHQGDPEADTRFKELNEAYDILKDDQKKAAYDQFGHDAFANGTGGRPGGRTHAENYGAAFSDVFADIFGDIMGRQRGRSTSRVQRGSDLRYDLRITLEEAYAGTIAEIKIEGPCACEACAGTGAEGDSQPTQCPTCVGLGKLRAQQGFFTVEKVCPTCAGLGQLNTHPCGVCSGSGRTDKRRTLSVNIPAGVETGSRIRLTGEGDAGLHGGPSGDLFIFIEVTAHALFRREGKTLFCDVPISMASAALGGEVEVPVIDGGRLSVKVPAGTQSGQVMRLRGKGMPAINAINQDNPMGDMMIELIVETPVNLTARQREILAEFESETASNSPRRDGFTEKIKAFWDTITG